MKALLIQPKSGFSFWSFPRALRLTGKKANSLPLGLLTVAALFPSRWKLRLVDRAVRDLTEDDWNWADIVLLSGNVLHRTNLLQLIKEANHRKKTVVVGGPVASSCTEEIMDAGTLLVVKGEAENVFPQLVSAMSGGSGPRLFESDDKPDMTLSPIPRFDLVDPRHYNNAMIQTTRGCPFNCEFCDVIALYGRKPRFKTPAQVIQELESLYGLGWRGSLFICDDNFIGHKANARAILRELITWQETRGKPFTFSTQVSMNLALDRPLIDLMTAAGFRDVTVGVESPDKAVLQINRKYQNLENPLVDSLVSLCKNGLPVLGTFIVGFDGEPMGINKRICALVEAANLPVAVPSTLWAFPHTSLWNRLKKEGRLLPKPVLSEDFIGGEFNFIPSRNQGEILAEFTQIWDYLYEPSRFLARAYRYYLSMRPTRQAMAKNSGESPSRLRESVLFRTGFKDLKALFRIAFFFSIRLRRPVQFMRQLVGILRHNPSRVTQYLTACAYGLDLCLIRSMLKNRRRP